MAKKSSKKSLKPVRPQLGDGVEILNAGSVLEDPITRTLETNYMPYAMSVIVSRALPEIDGFKPAHRKLLYTMYEMGLLKGARTKSANIVGSTMHLNPHGDAAIYDTMVRMGRGNESLLVPFVDSKGNFGKAYSRDMSCAASRYTEAKLENVCEELFRDIDKETVDFVPNYDGSTTEPTLLPVTFPTILANNTLGIAVGMACNICSFNLTELCNTTIALMKDAKHDISTTMPAPDFVGGGQILYDEAQMREIYEYGRGSVKVRARYNVVPGENMIEITQIPPTTTVEAIMDKIAELVKAGKIKEISDMRDETDLNGLKLTLDLKRGVDAEKLMAKLFKTTPLEDSFSANFNVLVSGQPRVMGVREILLYHRRRLRGLALALAHVHGADGTIRVDSTNGAFIHARTLRQLTARRLHRRQQVGLVHHVQEIGLILLAVLVGGLVVVDNDVKGVAAAGLHRDELLVGGLIVEQVTGHKVAVLGEALAGVNGFRGQRLHRVKAIPFLTAPGISRDRHAAHQNSGAERRRQLLHPLVHSLSSLSADFGTFCPKVPPLLMV